jgi:epoxide hydrolase 4
MLDGTYEFFFETNGVRLHNVMAGDPAGKSVILPHSFLQFWYGWRHPIPTLMEAGYRLIVPDQRGYNLSKKNQEERVPAGSKI